MSRVTFVRHLAACGIALGTVLLATPSLAPAADLDDYERRYSARPYPPEPVPHYEPRVYAPPPVYRGYNGPPRRVEIDPGECRVIVKRYLDDEGREITRRTRDCGRVASRGWDESRRYVPRRERYEEPAYDYRPQRPVVPEIEEDLD